MSTENRLKLLLVEDSEDDALLLLRQLRKGGFEVDHLRVQGAPEMARCLEDEDWDIIISDYNLPEFNGLAALNLLKNRELDIPFISISGAIGEESAVELLKAGAGDFIKKGNWARLVPAVRRELREARNRREERLARKAKAEAEERYTRLFENAVEGIFQSTPEGKFLSVNPAMARIHGYASPEEMIREINDIGRQMYVNPVKRLELMRQLKTQGQVSGFEMQVQRKDGDVIWVALHARAVFGDQGEFKYLEGMLEDITKRKRAEEQLFHNAFYDGLTGLPNRALFLDRLERALERSKRKRGGSLLAVLFLDLDEFKTINDSLGHQAGDELLVFMGETLRKVLRTVDTVARFGGDEFAVLLEDVVSVREVLDVAKRLQQGVSRPHTIEGREVFTTASIGIVLGSDEEYKGPDEVLRDADTAMYRAKSLGRNRFKVFNKRMGKQAVDRLEMETDLRLAVREEQFLIHYQPIISCSTGRVVGAEALARWNHPRRGLISPSEFIPVAEETGVISSLGHWVLNTAVAQARYWQESVEGLDDFFISVNLSGKQLVQPELLDSVRNVLADTGMDPKRLKLEITESVLMDNAQVAVNRLERLRELGALLALDDFGTGYSSLSHLHQFPLDVLKIDRSFVARMQFSDRDSGIVRTIISLAKAMGMEAVAEGVETAQQLTALRELDCRFCQGFLFAEPLPPKVFLDWMENWGGWEKDEPARL